MDVTVLTVLNAVLRQTEGATATESAAKLTAMFNPGPEQVCDPQFSLLRVTSAFLGRLAVHRDYEVWAEEDCDDTDGLLREIIHQAQALRPRLIGGIPDPPAGSEIWARADELATPETRWQFRLLAAAVEAFQDAVPDAPPSIRDVWGPKGLSTGSHFIGMAEYVWGFKDTVSADERLTTDQARGTLTGLLGRDAPVDAILSLAAAPEFGMSWTHTFDPPKPTREWRKGIKKITVEGDDDAQMFRVRYEV